jgi:hypothetical protein
MTLAHQADAAVPGLFDDLDPSRVEIAIRLEEDDGALAFGPEKFDSDVFGLQVGRILAVRAGAPQRHQALLDALIPRVRTLGYAQVLRRVPATGLDEIWALERSGFELMDIGLTFGRTLDRPITAPTYPDLVVRPSTDADLEQMVVAMLELPWGSRYEADPHYSVAQVRELRTRWLWNSHRGRAAAFLIGAIDGQPAGYVTCLLDERSRHGEIELVGTQTGGLPNHRSRGRLVLDACGSRDGANAGHELRRRGAV